MQDRYSDLGFDLKDHEPPVVFLHVFSKYRRTLCGDIYPVT